MASEEQMISHIQLLLERENTELVIISSDIKKLPLSKKHNHHFILHKSRNYTLIMSHFNNLGYLVSNSASKDNYYVTITSK